MNTALLQRIPAGVRDVFYLAILVSGFALGGVQTAYLAADTDQPQWLVVAFAVYAYISGAFGLTASQNVAPAAAEEFADIDEHWSDEGEHVALDDEEYEGRRVAGDY